MIEGCDKLAFVGFSVEACELIAQELNKKKPGNAFQLSELIADMGATVCVTIADNIIRVTNMTGLLDEFMEDSENDG